RAADTVVAGLAAAAAEVGVDAVRGARHRLEHVEMLDPADAARLAAWGVTASMQPAFDALWGGDAALYAQRLGGERAGRLNVIGALRAAGVRVAFGSDTPVTPFAPWYGVRAAVHHQTPQQAIDPEAAFAAHTHAGWEAAGLSGGRLAPGEPASLVVWDVTPVTAAVPALDLGSPLPTAHLTLVQGRIAHEQTGALRSAHAHLAVRPSPWTPRPSAPPGGSPAGPAARSCGSPSSTPPSRSSARPCAWPASTGPTPRAPPGPTGCSTRSGATSASPTACACRPSTHCAGARRPTSPNWHRRRPSAPCASGCRRDVSAPGRPRWRASRSARACAASTPAAASANASSPGSGTPPRSRGST